MTGKTLWDVYKNPSKEKIDAWRKIEHDITMRKGYDVVVRGSSFSFSVMYKYKDVQGYTHLVYETKDQSSDNISYTIDDIKAVYSIGIDTGYGILNILAGDKVVYGYVYCGHLYEIKTVQIYYSLSGRPYIKRLGRRLYLDNFMKIK